MGFAPEALRQDRFLAGRVAAWQPRQGFRSSTDAVFLAAAVPARAGEAVLDLGCGAGVACLCLAARVPGADIVGVEVQPDYAALARVNGVAAETADLAALPDTVRMRSFDHVMANPPWFDAAGTGAADAGRDRAQRATMPLADWIGTGLRRLRTGGTLTMIHRAESLPAILAALTGPAGAVAVLPLAPRTGRAAGRVIVQGRKGARGPFRLLAPLIVHAGPAHDGDRDDFAPTAQAVLRGGAPLDLGTVRR